MVKQFACSDRFCRCIAFVDTYYDHCFDGRVLTVNALRSPSPQGTPRHRAAPGHHQRTLEMKEMEQHLLNASLLGVCHRPNVPDFILMHTDDVTKSQLLSLLSINVRFSQTSSLQTGVINLQNYLWYSTYITTHIYH